MAFLRELRVCGTDCRAGSAEIFPSSSTTSALSSSLRSASMDGSAAQELSWWSFSVAMSFATDVSAEALSAPTFMSRSLPPASFVLTQPVSGPDPVSRLYCKRSSSSCSSRTNAPWLRRPGASAEDLSFPVRTRMPPFSSPPTTSQTPVAWSTRSLPF